MHPAIAQAKDGVYYGDSLRLIEMLPDESIDALITDPPYSSGGLHAGERRQAPGEKYQQSGSKLRFPDFDNDCKDQRSWMRWMREWLSMALPKLKKGAYIQLFTDWRQLPATTDVLQMAGFQWRGIVVWDKTEGSRAPHTGYFRHQTEFIVWGTRGKLPKCQHGGPFPGCFRIPNRPSERVHMTGKPLELMRRLVEPVAPGGLILDPFSGGGSTPVAAADTGRRAIAFEMVPGYYDISSDRYEEARAKYGEVA